MEIQLFGPARKLAVPRRSARRLRGAVLLLTAAGLGLSPVVSADDAAGTGASSLLTLIQQRLQLMEQVAAYKWLHGVPIEDPEREAAVVERSVAAALNVGMTPESATAFFEAQIAAAKAVQAHWFALWEAGAGPAAAPDLVTVIRPQLLVLGDRIVRAAAAGGRSAPAPDRDGFDAAVAVPGLDEPQRAALHRAVMGLKFFSNRLEQIRATGRLRVGTTGDYAPFSLAPDGPAAAAERGALVGIDIDLARDLGAALGARVEFVQTSWPGLVDDLHAGRYDIAMSGVSRTLARQQVGFLSPPYYAGGKTPIARCAEAARFDTLEKIDRADVRLIVNPGGTNEAFVRRHVRRADVRVHPDNRTIFQQIVNGDADVMITDRIEVALQTAREPSLCATMAGNLNYQEKAYLLPRDGVWKEFVATWLSLRLADGTVAAAFARHGMEPARVSGADKVRLSGLPGSSPASSPDR